MASRGYTVAVVGATGVVGSEVLRLLDERQFAVSELRAFDAEHRAGDTLDVEGHEVRVDPLLDESFDGVDLAFFCAGDEISGVWASRAVEAGAVVIDRSSRFRLDPDVPLVVPEVNAADARARSRGIVASPSSVTVPLAVVLKPLADRAGVTRAVATTFEAVSASGRRGIEALSRETVELLNMRQGKAPKPVFPHRIAFNAIPQVGALLAQGESAGEAQVVAETAKVMRDPDLALALTRARVPVFYGHAIALTIETGEPLGGDGARRVLREAPGILLSDAGGERPYPTPADVGGTDAVAVGRVRDDPSRPNTIQLWVAVDNVRKGAALNAVQIAEIVARDLRSADGD